MQFGADKTAQTVLSGVELPLRRRGVLPLWRSNVAVAEGEIWIVIFSRENGF